jgi:hypothetical protein
MQSVRIMIYASSSTVSQLLADQTILVAGTFNYDIPSGTIGQTFEVYAYSLDLKGSMTVYIQ